MSTIYLEGGGDSNQLKIRCREGFRKLLEKCSNAYAKGKRSFEVLGEFDPEVLKPHLPSFDRMLRILDTSL